MANNKTSLLVSTDLGDYDVSMKLLRNTHFPRAVADYLNIVADNVTRDQIRNAKQDFTLRAKFTLNSMTSARAKPIQALNKAGGKELKSMFSRAGTTSKYLWMHEEDYTNKPLGGRVPIATLNARTGKSFKRVINGTYRLRKGSSLSPGEIRFNKGDTTGFIGIPKGRKKYGIYERNQYGGLTMIRNLESSQTKIKGTGFHSKAVKKFGQMKGGKANITFQSRLKAEMSKNPTFRKNVLGRV